MSTSLNYIFSVGTIKAINIMYNDRCKILSIVAGTEEVFHGINNYYYYTTSYYYYYHHCLMYQILPYLMRATDTFSIPFSQRNCMLTPSSRTAEWPSLLTVRKHILSQSIYLKHVFRRRISLAWLFKDQPLWRSHVQQNSVEGIERKKEKRRHSSLQVPNTFSLIPFQFMRFDKEIKALLRAIPISQCKYSLKIATSRRALISMSLL